MARRKESVEFPEAYSQEFESIIDTTIPASTLSELQAQSASVLAAEAFNSNRATEGGYASYQLIRNVLAAHATDCSFACCTTSAGPTCVKSGSKCLRR